MLSVGPRAVHWSRKPVRSFSRRLHHRHWAQRWGFFAVPGCRVSMNWRARAQRGIWKMWKWPQKMRFEPVDRFLWWLCRVWHSRCPKWCPWSRKSWVGVRRLCRRWGWRWCRTEKAWRTCGCWSPRSSQSRGSGDPCWARSAGRSSSGGTWIIFQITFRAWNYGKASNISASCYHFPQQKSPNRWELFQDHPVSIVPC